MNMIGAANNVKGCDKIPSQWKKLYCDIIKRKKVSKQEKQDHIHKVNISLDSKDANTLKYALGNKEVSWLDCFTGPVHAYVPMNSVDVTTSV